MSYRILIAEDNDEIISILRIFLENEGYSILVAKNGIDAYDLAKKENPDLMIVDVMMPGMDGITLTEKIRKIMPVPILILSAKNQDDDKILGLRKGADDYLAKPFNPMEVVARVESLLRRRYDLNTQKESLGSVRLGDLVLDLEHIRLKKSGKEIPITNTEYKILALLMTHPGKVYTRIQIYEAITGEKYVSEDNSIAVHISNLREKIGEFEHHKYLVTVRGLGYKMEQIDDE